MPITTIEFVANVAQAHGVVVSEEITVAGRDASFAPVPNGLPASLKQELNKLFSAGLYQHQVTGIELGLAGSDVCLATPTASGKTVVFASIVLSRLLATAGATALVLYPARALVSDQAAKWTALADACELDVEIIDGGVDVKERAERLDSADVVLMTPDVLHAWLLGRCDQPSNQNFLKNLRLLVLDEAHIYEGVFGTNMAFLVRRLRAVSSLRQCIASTATISDPAAFLKRLTGFSFQVVGPDQDGSRTHAKTFLHVPLPPRRLQQAVRDLVLDLTSSTDATGKFIAFVDSRKAVEELVAQTLQSRIKSSDEMEPEEGDDENETLSVEDLRVLPYRAGYEEIDRKAIQESLSHGSLAGVVSTSALELGIDIGDITTVVMAGVPSSIKSFWQRAGRSGRSGPGVVVVFDASQTIAAGALRQFLARAAEDNWIYPDNEYLQYANALCAADEALACPSYSESSFEDLPPGFVSMLRNERNPTQALPADLYALKQQANNAAKPHFAFPVRTGIEKQYKVHSVLSSSLLGTLGYSQVLNEAYPGAIYRYMARAYRVTEISHGKGEIRTKPLKGIGRTTARNQAMAFPLYPNGVLALFTSDRAFLMECSMQVNERVTGFVEIWGSRKTEHKYEVGSPYSQKPLTRYFDTSGVLFHFSGIEYSKEKCARFLARSFCRVCGIQEREIGHGLFSAKSSPLGGENLIGMAIYDSVQGSLRLTRKFLQNVDAIFEEAIQLATADDATSIAGSLMQLRAIASGCSAVGTGHATTSSATHALDEWLEVIADGGSGILHDGGMHMSEEVKVQKFLYTPQGPVYFLAPPTPGVTWKVQASLVKPIPGQTATYKYNLNTGETMPLQ